MLSSAIGRDHKETTTSQSQRCCMCQVTLTCNRLISCGSKQGYYQKETTNLVNFSTTVTMLETIYFPIFMNFEMSHKFECLINLNCKMFTNLQNNVFQPEYVLTSPLYSIHWDVQTWRLIGIPINKCKKTVIFLVMTLRLLLGEHSNAYTSILFFYII